MRAVLDTGETSKRAKIVGRLGGAAGVVALVCGGLLIADHYVGVRRDAADKARYERLEEEVKTDAVVAERLHEERDLVRDRSLARKARTRVFGWVLVVAGGVFLVCGKQLLAARPQPAPELDKLVAARFPPSASASGRLLAALPPAPPGAEDGIDLSFVEDLVDEFGRDREAAIPILQAIQTHYRYLPDEVLRRVCELTDITPAQIAGTSSFYAQFRRSPVGRCVVRVCHGTACHVAGADQITQELRRHLEIPRGEDTDPRRLFTIDKVACVGCCSLAPVMMIEEETAGHLTPASARQTLDELVPSS